MYICFKLINNQYKKSTYSVFELSIFQNSVKFQKKKNKKN